MKSVERYEGVERYVQSARIESQLHKITRSVEEQQQKVASDVKILEGLNKSVEEQKYKVSIGEKILEGLEDFQANRRSEFERDEAIIRLGYSSRHIQHGLASSNFGGYCFCDTGRILEKTN